MAINNWYGPFWDLIQAILSKTVTVGVERVYAEIGTFMGIAGVAVIVSALTVFLVSHYVFRWRTAMNSYYMENWPRLRHIEGASQRVQEDTMRFSTIVEGLGVNLIDSVMTLIAFMPVLLRLSVNITELPIVGAVPYPLVLAALFWSIFGTVVLALVGYKLPGLQFRNQRVEAAYRKELVYGEDNAGRAQPPTVQELFDNVRRNYFRLYFHYVYFNIVRYVYLQANNIFSLLPDGPFHRCRDDHAGSPEPDQLRIFPGYLVVPVSGQFVADHRRAPVGLQAPASLRGHAGRRAAARDRPALSGTCTGWRGA